jgi:hypothetical protein
MVVAWLYFDDGLWKYGGFSAMNVTAQIALQIQQSNKLGASNSESF